MPFSATFVGAIYSAFFAAIQAAFVGTVIATKCSANTAAEQHTNWSAHAAAFRHSFIPAKWFSVLTTIFAAKRAACSDSDSAALKAAV